jgi:hypothetical protein
VLPIDPSVELSTNRGADAITRHLDAQTEMRHEAVRAGEIWERYVPPILARTALDAAANAYSAAWESSRHEVGDHLRALRSALAAADPILARWHTNEAVS